MRIPSTNQPVTLTLEALRTQLLQNLRPGQVLKAIALSENTGGLVKLSIGGAELTARTELPTAAGQRLTLSVTRTGPLPELQLLEQDSAAQLRTRALKTALPRQEPLSQLLEKLVRLSDSKSPSGLPPDLRKAAETLLGSTLASDAPSLRHSLPASVSDSGLFLERGLMQGSNPAGDLKLHLLRWLFLLRAFARDSGAETGAAAERKTPVFNPARREEPAAFSQQARPAPQRRPAAESAQNQAGTYLTTSKYLADLVRTTEGALARIQINQLNSLPPGEDQATQVWQTDLPVRQDDRIDDFQIRFQRDNPSPDGSSGSTWAVTLMFNLEPLGPMQTKLVLNQTRIASTFWAERADTTHLIRRNLKWLQAALEKAGLEVSNLSVYEGLPMEPETTTYGMRLIDEMA